MERKKGSRVSDYERKKEREMPRFSFSRRGNERGLSSFDFIARAKVCVSFFSFLKVGWGKITKREMRSREKHFARR